MTSTADLVTQSVADLKEKDERTFSELSFTEKVSYVQEVITVEPLIAAYVMAAMLCQPTLYNLEYEKACRVNLQMNDTVCEAILSGKNENYTKEDTEVVALINNVHSWQNPLQSFMPLILVLFLGSYSDRHQCRKPFLLIPIAGEFFAVVGCILCVVFMRSWTLEVQGVFQLIIPSFFGGQPMIVMAVFAYIADVSTLQMRTLRIGVVQIVLNVTIPLAQLISANYFELVGYYGVLCTAGGLYAFGFIYGIFWIKEPRKPSISGNWMIVLSDIFNPRHAVETFGLILKKSPGKNRLFIVSMLFTMFIYSAVVVSEAGIFYYYTKSRFGWTIVDYSYFSTVNTLVHLLGTALAVPLFTKVLNLTDMSILLLTFLDKIMSNFVFGFANTNMLLYAAAIVSIITGVTPIGIRSVATKIVSEEDLGKAQSLFGICEAIAPAIATPIYNTLIYNNTATTFPAAFFFFGILLYSICCVIISWMYFVERKNRKTASCEEKSNGNGMPMENVNGNGRSIENHEQTSHL
ncbi:hypothetical protein JTB14_016532 [Gonioctena quinquepunctata]|nr:hypothetical protein JTB14_016532 [Gonioctena quinquepunctata]